MSPRQGPPLGSSRSAQLKRMLLWSREQSLLPALQPCCLRFSHVLKEQNWRHCLLRRKRKYPTLRPETVAVPRGVLRHIYICNIVKIAETATVNIVPVSKR
jgi:hypothetical protein